MNKNNPCATYQENNNIHFVCKESSTSQETVESLRQNNLTTDKPKPIFVALCDYHHQILHLVRPMGVEPSQEPVEDNEAVKAIDRLVQEIRACNDLFN